MRKVQWCVKCKKYHLFDDVNWKYNWKQRTWECLKTVNLLDEDQPPGFPSLVSKQRFLFKAFQNLGQFNLVLVPLKN